MMVMWSCGGIQPEGGVRRKKENEQDDGEQEEDEVAPRSRVVASWVWDLVIPVRSIILLVIRASHLWTHGGPYLRDFSESVAARSYMAPLYFSTPFSASSAASGNSAFEMQWTGWGVQCNTLQCFNSHELCQKWRIFDDCSPTFNWLTRKINFGVMMEVVVVLRF